MKTTFLKSTIYILTLMTSVYTFSQASIQDKIYTKVEIKGMACPFCAGGLGKAFEEILGVQEVDIDFDNGMAYITSEFIYKPSKETLKKIVIEAGFEVGEISYSDKPFEKPKKKQKL